MSHSFEKRLERQLEALAKNLAWAEAACALGQLTPERLARIRRAVHRDKRAILAVLRGQRRARGAS